MVISAITTPLVIMGAGLMLIALISGIRLTKKIPTRLQDKWRFLLMLMAIFFCGHLLFAALLFRRFPFPDILIGLSIFLGGAFSLLVIHLTKGALKKFQEEECKLSKATANIQQKERKLAESNALYLKDLFEMIAEVLANRDQHTFEHDLQVAAIAKLIGEKLGLSEETLTSLELGCLAHDIGKTAIPDDILLKPAKFTFQDRNIMEYHPLIGAKLVARHIQDDKVIDIILNHHERLDGSGYPAGLKGDEIGILPRIVAAADTYESLISRRSYKKPISTEEALDILREEVAKGRLDGRIVDILIAIVPQLPEVEETIPITAGFMKNIEIFRNRTYFREPLSDFYNYRYLLFLDDAEVLHKETLPYDLMLISFPNFGTFQQEKGYLVADQAFDEIGQNLLDICKNFSQPRDFYDGSVMLFRKRNDYLIYQEHEDENTASVSVFNDISKTLSRFKEEWGLHFILVSHPCPPGQPTSKALHNLLKKAEPAIHKKTAGHLDQEPIS
ncbi:MAG: HD domain-containing protein [Desulfurivibrionaceae bacterium]|nr:HD domain-containing protein [Desulfurivibrionaceae bacterium]